MSDLFGSESDPNMINQVLGPQALILRGFALPYENSLFQAIKTIEAQSPFRTLYTKRGYAMSVQMTNCGNLGWISDRKGYRYVNADPLTSKPWPSIPTLWLELAKKAASHLGFPHYHPDACLVNRYQPGSKMSLHQDKDERDQQSPIVSVSLGVTAEFLFGGFERQDKPERFLLHHGDIAVWGGESRMRFHGVKPMKVSSQHPLTGEIRYNLTFRKVL